MPALITTKELEMSTYKAKSGARPAPLKLAGKNRDKKKSKRDIATLSVEDIHYTGGPTMITETVLEASYNWISSKNQPKIFVPGCPRAWQDVSHENQEPEVIRAIIALRPVHPAVPAMQSLLFTSPDVSTAAIDIIAEDRTLLTLLRWAGLHSWSFKFEVDVLGNAVIFSRHSDTTYSRLKQMVLRAKTQWLLAVTGSEAHHRVISYSLGNMRLLVHCECDGYLPDLAGSSNSSVPADAGVSEKVHDGSGPGLLVERYGRYIGQEAIFDLKVNSTSNAALYNDNLCSRLWVRQCPNLLSIKRVSSNGRLTEPEMTVMTDTVRQWEEENQDTLARYKVALRYIAMKARANKDKKLEVIRRDDGPLELRIRGGEGLLTIPLQFKERWVLGSETGLRAASR